jgi:hypothetical protein
MFPAPQKEHEWLSRLVGDWKSQMECVMGPDQPPTKSEGKESVRSFGGLWTLGEGFGQSPDGQDVHSVMTLGFDPQRGKFVGTFIASCMTNLWLYEGSLDASGKILTLDTEGPSFTGDGTMSKYQDIIEFISDDHRTLSSQVLQPDGSWVRFMTAHYYRVK